jgi:hypothetical protein
MSLTDLSSLCFVHIHAIKVSWTDDMRFQNSRQLIRHAIKTVYRGILAVFFTMLLLVLLEESIIPGQCTG